MAKKAPSFKVWDDTNATLWPAWSTGNPFLDWVTGITGLPKGRLVHTYGPESSGKSSMALQAAAHAWTTQGIPSVYVDFEDAFDPLYAQALGLTSAGLKLSEAATLEAMFAELAYLVQNAATQPYALYIVDSVAAARAEAERDALGSTENTAGMVKAKLWTDNLGTFVKPLSASGITLVLVNQLRDNIQINQGWVPPAVAAMQPKTRTPGGRGIKFYSSLSIEFTPGAQIKEPRYDPVLNETRDQAIGKHVVLNVTKNKVAPPPWRRTRLQIRDGLGFDPTQNLLDFADIHGILNRTKGVWTFPAELSPTGQPFQIKAAEGFSGDTICAHFLRERPNMRATVEAAVLEKLASAADYVAAPPSPTEAEEQELPE